jgi:hypothetical protein
VYRERADLWNSRPVSPLLSDFDELRSASTFEQAVDVGQQIQRWILEKHAWYRMAESWLDYRGKDLALSAVQVKAAKEEYLGVWIHGVSEEDLKFFLGHARVPCFFIHELIEGEDPGTLVVTDFVQGTPVAQLLDPQNSEYDRVALRLNGGEHTLHDASLPLPGIAFRSNDERLLSGSRNQYGPRPLEGSVRSESPGGVSIPGSDEDDELPTDERATVSTGSEWTATPRSMILGAEVTVAMMEEVKVTPILKFTVPDTFFAGRHEGLASVSDEASGWRTLAASRSCRVAPARSLLYRVQHGRHSAPCEGPSRREGWNDPACGVH